MFKTSQDGKKYWHFLFDRGREEFVNSGWALKSNHFALTEVNGSAYYPACVPGINK